MPRSKVQRRRQTRGAGSQSKWVLVAVDGVLPEEYSEFYNGIWAGDAIAAAKKVYRRMKWAESITVASCDNHNEVHHFDSSEFSLSADHKRSQDHRRSCMSKLDVALAGYVS
ncbi:Uncharacterized protein PBTT_00246 [Plasmodiophora brassicae]